MKRRQTTLTFILLSLRTKAEHTDVNTRKTQVTTSAHKKQSTPSAWSSVVQTSWIIKTIMTTDQLTELISLWQKNYFLWMKNIKMFISLYKTSKFKVYDSSFSDSCCGHPCARSPVSGSTSLSRSETGRGKKKSAGCLNGIRGNETRKNCTCKTFNNITYVTEGGEQTLAIKTQHISTFTCHIHIYKRAVYTDFQNKSGSTCL